MRQVTLKRLGCVTTQGDLDLIRKLVGDAADVKQGPHGAVTVTGLDEEQAAALVEFGRTLNFETRKVIG